MTTDPKSPLEDALALFSYVGACTFDCGHRFCKEQRADHAYGEEVLAAIDAVLGAQEVGE